MSTVLARRVISTPVRTPKQTWEKIIEIIAPDPQSAARNDLSAAEGVACSAIAAEATKEAAIVVWGSGPRIRVYCVFDDDAITQDGINEEALPSSPTEGDWQVSIPCLPEDEKWSKANLAGISTRISARSMDEDVQDEEPTAKASTPAMSINLEEFKKS